MKHKNSVILSTLFCALLFFPALATGQSYSAGNVKLGEIKTPSGDGEKTELEKWREDLHFIAQELPRRHNDLFRRLDRDLFYSEIKELNERLPEMTANRAALEFERIVGLARDGHTYTSPVYSENIKFRLYPYAMYAFTDGIYIRRAAPEYKDILGAKVLKVGNLSTEDAYRKVAPYMSTDNEMGRMDYVPRYLGVPEVLEALEISPYPNKVVLKLEKDGKVFDKEISLPEGQDNSTKAVRERIKDWPDARDGAENETPLSLRNIEKRFWFEYVPEKKMLYVHMKNVLDDDGMTLEQFWGKVFESVDANNPDKLVLDLRYNGGGNNTLVKPIITGIIKRDSINREGHFFVIIGRQTFSAAQNLTNMLEKWTEAVFVGEPTGSHVNMFGDAVSYHLPNSGMLLRISELFWQNMHARDERKWTAPQIVAELSFKDYVRNIDPALAAVEKPYERKTTLREIALAAYQKNDLPSFKEKAIAYKNDPRNKYEEIEAQVNEFGYALIRLKQHDLAIAMFQLNTELYPDSFNTWDSLAEGYLEKGDHANAEKYYKKSLELNPDNANAKRMLERMKNPPSPGH